MKANRLLAVLAVFLMISGPLFVVSDDNSVADANATEDAGFVSLNKLIESKSEEYWIKATGNETDGVTLTYNAGGKGCVVNYDLGYKEASCSITLESDGDFIIPSGSGFVDNGTVKAIDHSYILNAKSLLVYGTLYAREYLGKIGQYPEASYCPCRLQIGDDQSVSIIGGNVTIAPYFGTLIDSGIRLTEITNAASSDATLSIAVNEKKCLVMSGDAKGASSSSRIEACGTVYFKDLELENTSLSAFAWTSGNSSRIVLQSDLVCTADVWWDFLTCDGGSIVRFYDHAAVTDRLSDLLVSDEGKTFIFSCSLCYFPYGSTKEDEWVNDYFAAAIGDEMPSIVKEGVILMLYAQHGVKEIVTGSEKDILLAEVGKPFDLTGIEVECRDGYKFYGWYYVNSYGVECEVTDPANYVPTESVALYAVALPEKDVPEPEPQPTPTPTASTDNTTAIVILGAFIAVLVAIAIVAVRRND